MNATRVLEGKPRFELGRIGVTSRATSALDRAGLHPIDLVSRHVVGDWGDNIPAEQARRNQAAVQAGGTLVSTYRVETGRDSVWVLTWQDAALTLVVSGDELYVADDGTLRVWEPHELSGGCQVGCGHSAENIAWRRELERRHAARRAAARAPRRQAPRRRSQCVEKGPGDQPRPHGAGRPTHSP